MVLCLLLPKKNLGTVLTGLSPLTWIANMNKNSKFCNVLLNKLCTTGFQFFGKNIFTATVRATISNKSLLNSFKEMFLVRPESRSWQWLSKNLGYTFADSGYLLTLQSHLTGLVAEWLGKALQKPLQRFESARDLTLIVLKPCKLITCRAFVVSGCGWEIKGY